ncbi:MAG: DUF2071 domain-containing protein [Acidobacteriota bacterium]
MTTHTPNMQNIVARDLSFGLRVGKVEGRGHRIERGRVMTSIELNHISLIIYRIPVSRVSQYLPPGTTLDTTSDGGTEMAWLSVLSCIDQGMGGVENTTYRLHILSEGRPAQLVLGVSLGSLASVGARHLWQLPWHLGAMELQAAYDQANGRYSDYRLQTQSQWDNARWEMSDSGRAIEPVSLAGMGIPKSVLSARIKMIYSRPVSQNNAGKAEPATLNSHNGETEVVQADWMMTRAELKVARSEFLERSGLMSREELANPVLVGLQAQGTVTLYPLASERRERSTIIGSPSSIVARTI